jgi:hypothetical protein
VQVTLIIFSLFLFITQIVLLNMLIALMRDIYSKVGRFPLKMDDILVKYPLKSLWCFVYFVKRQLCAPHSS